MLRVIVKFMDKVGLVLWYGFRVRLRIRVRVKIRVSIWVRC